MRRGPCSIMAAIGILAGIVFLAGYLGADEAEEITRGLVSGLGIPADAVGQIVQGPGDTFGQRLQDALHNKAVSQEQYDAIMGRFLALPDGKRWAIKGAYDHGEGVPGRVLPPQDASLRDHIKDLRQQGLTREQIAERLRHEGVSPDHLKDIGYGHPEPSPRAAHMKDMERMKRKNDRGASPGIVQPPNMK